MFKSVLQAFILLLKHRQNFLKKKFQISHILICAVTIFQDPDFIKTLQSVKNKAAYINLFYSQGDEVSVCEIFPDPFCEICLRPLIINLPNVNPDPTGCTNSPGFGFINDALDGNLK